MGAKKRVRTVAHQGPTFPDAARRAREARRSAAQELERQHESLQIAQQEESARREALRALVQHVVSEIESVVRVAPKGLPEWKAQALGIDAFTAGVEWALEFGNRPFPWQIDAEAVRWTTKRLIRWEASGT